MSMEINAIITDLSKECEMSVLEDHLDEMFISWVRYQDAPTREHREDITFAYETLRNHLRRIDTFLNNKK